MRARKSGVITVFKAQQNSLFSRLCARPWCSATHLGLELPFERGAWIWPCFDNRRGRVCSALSLSFLPRAQERCTQLALFAFWAWEFMTCAPRKRVKFEFKGGGTCNEISTSNPIIVVNFSSSFSSTPFSRRGETSTPSAWQA
jgi:hypothetical protein